MKTGTFFAVTAVVEAGAGLGLSARPSAAVAFLFGSPLSTTEGTAIGRIAGAALLALGAACWLSRNDVESRSMTGLVRASCCTTAARPQSSHTPAWSRGYSGSPSGRG